MYLIYEFIYLNYSRGHHALIQRFEPLTSCQVSDQLNVIRFLRQYVSLSAQQNEFSTLVFLTFHTSINNFPSNTAKIRNIFSKAVSFPNSSRWSPEQQKQSRTAIEFPSSRSPLDFSYSRASLISFFFSEVLVWVSQVWRRVFIDVTWHVKGRCLGITRVGINRPFLWTSWMYFNVQLSAAMRVTMLLLSFTFPSSGSLSLIVEAFHNNLRRSVFETFAYLLASLYCSFSVFVMHSCFFSPNETVFTERTTIKSLMASFVLIFPLYVHSFSFASSVLSPSLLVACPLT